MPYLEYDEFLSGLRRGSDYMVAYGNNAQGDRVLMLVLKNDHVQEFRNARIKWITQNAITDPEFIVEWDSKKSKWSFSISKACKSTLNGKLLKNLFFVIVDEANPDILIRSILIESEKILKSKVSFPFISDRERNLDKINIGTKSELATYKLVKK